MGAAFKASPRKTHKHMGIPRFKDTGHGLSRAFFSRLVGAHGSKELQRHLPTTPRKQGADARAEADPET